ncbi:MAG: metallophosphoesterase family protein [Raoultibacter sp.]
MNKPVDSAVKTVGILSDTHGRLPVAVFAALEECDYLIHAGDIGAARILRELETIAPVYAVLGNNDYAEYGEAVGQFALPVIEGVRFIVAHYLQDIQAALKGAGPVHPGDPLPQIGVYGHTHVPAILTGADAGCTQALICPGSVAYPRGGSKPSVAKLTLCDGRVSDMHIEELPC